MKPKQLLLAVSWCFGFSLSLHAEIANRLPHQGRVVVDGANFDGTGQFKFLLYTDNEVGTPAPVWSNAETEPTDLTEPSSAVSLTVVKGLYSVFLGDTGVPNMEALPDSIEPPEGFFLYLRIWFDDGIHGFQQLSPDQLVGSAAFALHARSVTAGGVDSSALAGGSVREDHLADGAVSHAKLAAGAAAANIDAAGELGIGLEGADPVAALEVAGGVEFVSPEIVSVIRDITIFRPRLDSPSQAGVVVRERVGIGTATPGAELEVVGDSIVSGTLRPGELYAEPTSGIGLGIGEYGAQAGLHLNSGRGFLEPVLHATLSDGQNGFERLFRPSAVALSLPFAFVTSDVENALTVIDLGDPDSPTLFREFSQGEDGFNALLGATDVAVQGGAFYAFVAARESDALTILVPRAFGGSNLIAELVDGEGGFDELDGAFRVVLHPLFSRLAFVLAGEDQALSIIDARDTSNVSLRSVVKQGVDGVTSFAELRDIAVGQRTAYVATADGLTIIDIDDLDSPEVVQVIEGGGAALPNLGSPRSIALDDDLLYLATTTAIHVLDVSSPQAPALIVSITPSAQFPGSGFLGSDQLLTSSGRLFSVNAFNAVGVVDVRKPSSPYRVGFIRRASEGLLRPYRAAVEGDLMVVVDRASPEEVAILDLSEFRQVDLVARNRVGIGISTPRANLEVLNTFMAGQILDRTLSAGEIGDLLTSEGEFGNYVWKDSIDLAGSAAVAGDITGGANVVAAGNLSGVDITASGNLAVGGALMATGAVSSDASLTAPAHRLTQAETFVYNLPGNTLHVRDEGETYVRSTNGYVFVGAGTTTLSLFGPVHLPQGAVVTGASVLYQDNTDSGDFTEFDGRLRRRAIASSSNENIAVLQDAAPQSAASTDILSVEDSNPVTERATIDNDAYQYWMYVEATVDAPGDSSLRVYGFRVTYELDALLP